MRIFSWEIHRLKGTGLRSYAAAIIDLQARVVLLEHHRAVRNKAVEVEAVKQGEIEKILGSGEPVGAGLDGIWEGM